MLKTNLIILFCLLAWTARAQEPQPGQVVLANQTVITGVVDINSFINSAIVTTDDGRQLTYHASMIDQITVIDECDRVRRFQTFDYRSNSFFRPDGKEAVPRGGSGRNHAAAPGI